MLALSSAGTVGVDEAVAEPQPRAHALADLVEQLERLVRALLVLSLGRVEVRRGGRRAVLQDVERRVRRDDDERAVLGPDDVLRDNVYPPDHPE